MTMPHLMNCSHMDDGWCLPCVKAEWEEREAEVERLRNGLRDMVSYTAVYGELAGEFAHELLTDG